MLDEHRYAWASFLCAEFALRSFTLNAMEEEDRDSALAEMLLRCVPVNVTRTLTCHAESSLQVCCAPWRADSTLRRSVCAQPCCWAIGITLIRSTSLSSSVIMTRKTA